MLATQSGLRPRFGLRQNGTLRTRKVKVDPAGRIIKMAEVYPPTEKAKLDNSPVVTQALPLLSMIVLDFVEI